MRCPCWAAGKSLTLEGIRTQHMPHYAQIRRGGWQKIISASYYLPTFDYSCLITRDDDSVFVITGGNLYGTGIGVTCGY